MTKTILRSLAVAGVVALAVFAFQRLVLVPWRCNAIEGIVAQTTKDPIATTDDFRMRRRAEQNLELISACVEQCRTNVNLAMLAAANLVILGRNDAAVAMYEQALRYDQRPELYRALAMAQSDLGRRDAALVNAVRAADFGGLEWLDGISDPIVRWRAYEIVATRHERALGATGREAIPLLQNGRFAARPGPEAVSLGRYGTIPSPARAWEVINPTGVTSVRLVQSTRTGGSALEVSTTSPVSGLRQRWRRGATAPRVRTSAWVYVKRGKVSIGSGNGAPMTNAYSTAIGRWEKLEGINESCPADSTMIQAASVGGADFVVDEVTVMRTAPYPPCEP